MGKVSSTVHLVTTVASPRRRRKKPKKPQPIVFQESIVKVLHQTHQDKTSQKLLTAKEGITEI